MEQLELTDEQCVFENDKFGFTTYATTLQGLIDAYADNGGVIAVNGDWGTGKSTFIKMCKKQFESENYNTLYYNAWETDFFNDPIIALMGELRNLVKDNKERETLDVEWNKVQRVLLHGLSTLVKGLSKKHLGADLSEFFNAIVDEYENVAKEDLKKYQENKSSLEAFKTALVNYVQKISNENGNKPVIFIVDELDRCNPHYAVRVLERIKHMFQIPNLVFVLTVCVKELENSVRGFYGSDKIDANNYLRRFFTIQYEMPKPSPRDIVFYLCDRFNISKIFANDQYDSYPEFTNFAIELIKVSDVDIRTAGRIFEYTKIVLFQLPERIRVNAIDLILFFCYSKIYCHEFYTLLKTPNIDLQSVVSQLETSLSSSCKTSVFYHSFAKLFYLVSLISNPTTTYDDFIQNLEFIVFKKIDKKDFQDYITQKMENGSFDFLRVNNYNTNTFANYVDLVNQFTMIE